MLSGGSSAPVSVPASIADSAKEMTFNSEGQEGGPYHSRTPSVPDANSGVTVGRGYDMKMRMYGQIVQHMTTAGVPANWRDALGKASGKAGPTAKKYIQDHLKGFELTFDQQKRLFDIVYAEKEAYARHLATKPDVVDKYKSFGTTSWENLNPLIRGVLIDLTFRGDYTSATRKHIQPFVAANDVRGFAAAMLDRSLWPSVPSDRFNRRAALVRPYAAPAPSMLKNILP
jgi:hypothetical protein